MAIANRKRQYVVPEVHAGGEMIFITANARFSSSDPDRNQKIIRNWNGTVTNADTVLHLGNFAVDRPLYYLHQLNGLIVSVVGDSDDDFPGPKFKNLFLYADGTFTQRQLPGRDDVLCILQAGEGSLSDSEFPEIFAVDYGDWRYKGYGERIIGCDFSYLLSKPVLNANIDLWDYRPISLQNITERYFCS